MSSSSSEDDSQTNREKIEEREQVYDKIESKIEILDILFHPTENNLITLGLINGKLKIILLFADQRFDLSKKKKRLVSQNKLHKKSVRKLAFTENNSDLIFTASKDKSIKLTDLKHESNVLTIENAHNEPINCLITIDNWLIASADDNGCVKIWDYRKKEAVMNAESDCADYISDLAVSRDRKILLATCGEGTLSAFHTRKKKMIMQSELMDSEMLCVGFMKDDKKVVCGTGDGVLNVFNYDEWGNISDRFPGHPSSIDCLQPLSDNIVLTGCFDGNIRACHILPNRFLGIVGSHADFPIQKLCLSSNKNVCASISHDECVRFWNVENIKCKVLNASSKSKSKKLKNKKLTAKGKAENFFSDLIENENEESDASGSDNDDSDNTSEDFSQDSDDSDSDS